MSEVVCTVCGRTVTVDENTTTCPSCGAPLALPVQHESFDSAAPAVTAGDPTDSAEVQAIPVADVAGEGPAHAAGVQVDPGASATPNAQEEPTAEASEAFAPASDGAEAYAVAYTSADGSQDGATAYATADSFEPVAVTYESVSYEAPSADAYVPPVPSTTESDYGTADTGDAGLEAWQTPAVVLDAIGVDTATGDVVEVVEVFTAEPVTEAPAQAPMEAPAEVSAPYTPEPAPVAAAPAAAEPAPVVAAPAPVVAPAPVAAPAPAVARMTTAAPATPDTSNDGGGIPSAIIGLLAVIVLAAVVVVVLYLTGAILQ